MTETVGKYLKNILDSRNISYSELSKDLGLKSRSTLYRLFNDKCSVSLAREIIHSIEHIVGFTKEESQQINRLFGDENVNPFYKKTREILSLLCRESLENGYRTESYDGKEIELKKILDKYSKYKTDVFVSDISDERIIGDLSEWLRYDHRSTLHYYVRLKHHRLLTAYEILAMVVLSRYANFYPCLNNNIFYKGICIIACDGDQYYFVSIYIDDGETRFLETTITRTHYEYLINGYASSERKRGYLRKPVAKVMDYIEYVETILNNENGEIFHFEGAPCFGNLSFDILYEMFGRINYFGFPSGHAYVRRLIDMMRMRHESSVENDELVKVFVFDHENLKYMMQTGISFDHVEEFEPMTPEQRKQYFEELYSNLSDSEKSSKCRFYKNKRISFPFVYKKSGYLSLYCTTTYGENYSILLFNSSVIDIMDDFTNYLWENYTCSEESSIEKIRMMMDEYLY